MNSQNIKQMLEKLAELKQVQETIASSDLKTNDNTPDSHIFKRYAPTVKSDKLILN